MTGIHSLKVSPLVTNSLVTPWQSSALSTGSVLYTYKTYTFAFLKPSVGSSSSVLSQHCPSQICTLSPSFLLSHNVSLPIGLLGRPRSCFFPRSIHLSSSFPLSHNVSLPIGLLSVILDLCPSPSFPLSHNVSLPVGLFHGEVDVIGLVLWCPLTTLELTRPMHWPLRIRPQSYLNNGPV